MTSEQKKAVTQLKRALNKCGSVGLKGGVYDSNFCLWPVGESPEEPSRTFFENVEDVGGVCWLPEKIYLDGGAGV